MQRQRFITIGLCLLALATTTARADERSDIHQLLKEINYTKEVVQQLKKQHRGCSAKICFHYNGLLAQLQAAENGIKAYLNLDIQSIHRQPSKPLQTPLYKVRKN